METYSTIYGELSGLALTTFHANGALKDCTVDHHMTLSTRYGDLTPQYTYDFRKKNHYALSFYEDGALRRISLNQTTEIPTPIGIMSAELILFYENGNIKRLFPLNGYLSAFWEESDEYQLAKEQSFDFPFGKITTKIISISFYEDGKIKDLTLWPKEKIKIPLIPTKVTTHIGLSLYPDANVKSVEPAYPTKLPTPIGYLLAYDKNANGISGDNNSLQFTKDGKLSSLITSGNKVTVMRNSQPVAIFSPWQELDVDDTELNFHSLLIEFQDDTVTFNHDASFDIPTNEFVIEPYTAIAVSQCSDCENCNTPCK